MNEAESHALLIAQDEAVDRYSSNHRFTSTDLCGLHRLWLDSIYEWAGQYRSVNIGKGGFQFAHAPLIPRLMGDLDRGVLAQRTPCMPDRDEAIARALAEVHAELILVHPFREGNGRLARMLALLMAFQSGLPPLDFSPMLARGRSAYIGAIHASVGGDYEPLSRIFLRIIALSRQRASSSRR